LHQDLLARTYLDIVCSTKLREESPAKPSVPSTQISRFANSWLFEQGGASPLDLLFSKKTTHKNKDAIKMVLYLMKKLRVERQGLDCINKNILQFAFKVRSETASPSPAAL
jgi:hypothetical protein